jgi:hypothetical protein
MTEAGYRATAVSYYCTVQVLYSTRFHVRSLTRDDPRDPSSIPGREESTLSDGDTQSLAR